MGISAHLERIAEDIDNPAGYLVLADWLQEQGNPWGRLIVLQSELAARPGDDALGAAVDSLLKKHREALVGDFLGKPNVILEWHLGFLRRVLVFAGYERPDEMVAALLQLPTARLLRELVVFVERERVDPAWLEAQWQKRLPPTLPTPIFADKFEDLETALEAPGSVRWLDLYGLDEVPQGVARLVNVEWLSLGGNLRQLPVGLGALSRLRRLDLDGSWNLESIPAEVLAIETLARVSLGGCESLPSASFHMGRINALLAGFRRARTPPERRLIEVLLLTGRHVRARELASNEQLLAALDNNTKVVRDAALRALEERLPDPLASKPLKKGDVVASVGSLNIEKKVLKQRLADLGVAMTIKVTGKTTHVLVGHKPKGKQLGLSLPILLEPHVLPLLGTGAPSIEATSLSAQLLGGVDAEISAAVGSLQEAGGVPAELWPELLYVHQNTELKGKGRRLAKKLFAAHAPKKLRAAVEQHFRTSVLGCGENKRTERLEALARDAGGEIDVLRLARLFLKNADAGHQYLLVAGTGEDIVFAVTSLMDDGHLELSGFELDNVPSEILKIPGLHQLSVADNRLVEFPLGLTELVSLEKLWLSSNLLATLPAAIGQMVGLRVLNLSQNRFARFPEALLALDKLEHLDLAAEVYHSQTYLEAIPDDIRRMKSLKTLTLDSQRLRALPDGLFDLGSLERLSVIGCALPPVPDALAKMTGLQDICVHWGSWAEPDQQARIRQLLPNVTIQDSTSY